MPTLVARMSDVELQDRSVGYLGSRVSVTWRSILYLPSLDYNADMEPYVVSGYLDDSADLTAPLIVCCDLRCTWQSLSSNSLRNLLGATPVLAHQLVATRGIRSGSEKATSIPELDTYLNGCYSFAYIPAGFQSTGKSNVSEDRSKCTYGQ